MKEAEFMQCHETNEEMKCLEKLIELVESLPKRMCDEIEKREELRKKEIQKQIEEQMESCRQTQREITRIICNLG